MKKSPKNNKEDLFVSKCSKGKVTTIFDYDILDSINIHLNYTLHLSKGSVDCTVKVNPKKKLRYLK